MSDPTATDGAAADVRPSLDAVQERIVAEMAGLEDPLDKYEYLIELGRDMEVTGDSIRTEANAVPGCQSRVWIETELRDGRLRIRADGEAVITRGLIALLIRVLDGRTPAEIRDADLFFLERTGLQAHLSPSRANGLANMVRQIRRQAEEAAG